MTSPKTYNVSVPHESIPAVQWEYKAHCYGCDVRLTKDASGWLAHCPALPGVVSEGDSLSDAVENIREALRASLRAYLKDGQPIPWVEPPEPRPGEHRKFIVVHAGDDT